MQEYLRLTGLLTVEQGSLLVGIFTQGIREIHYENYARPTWKQPF